MASWDEFPCTVDGSGFDEGSWMGERSWTGDASGTDEGSWTDGCTGIDEGSWMGEWSWTGGNSLLKEARKEGSAADECCWKDESENCCEISSTFGCVVSEEVDGLKKLVISCLFVFFFL